MALTAKKVYAILKRQIFDMEAKLNSPVRYRGTVATADLLPLNPDIGDMYNIESKSVYGEAGMNVAWNGVVWDTMGAPIDMSLYIKSSELADWVKQQNKPTYTANEVGALPANTKIPSKTSELKNDSGFLTKVPDSYLNGTDTTLRESGKAADAKATGDKFTEMSADISKKLDKNQGSENSGKIAGINESGDIVPMFPVGVEYNEETNCLEFGSDHGMKLNQGIGLDSTLTKTGFAADAGVTGKEIDSLKESLTDYTVDGYFALQGELSSRYFTPNGESTRSNSVMKYPIPSDVDYISIDMMILANVYYLVFTDSLENVLDICISTVGYDNKVYKNILVPSGATTLWLTNNATNAQNIKAYGKKKDINLYSKESADNVGFISTDGTIKDNNQYSHTRKIALDDVERMTVNAVWSNLIATISFYNSAGSFIGYISPDNQNNSSITSLLEVKKEQFPQNAKYAVVTIRTDFKYNSGIVVEYSKKTEMKTRDLKYMCFGDSITSEEVTGTGDIISDFLGTVLVGNFAHGNATCQDYKSTDGASNISPETPVVEYKGEGQTALQMPSNVLSNQIRRALSYTTNIGEDVSYKHPKAGIITLDNTIWKGTGSKNNIPDIIYIAIGINDGSGWTNPDGTTYRPTAYDSKGNQHDDSEEVYLKSYSELNRLGFCNALRWAIETLQCAYPKAQIFVASPLQTSHTDWTYRSYKNTKMKRDMVEKTSAFCSVHFIDSFSESGFSSMVASDSANGDGTHPSATWAKNNARFVANQIYTRYTEHN